jgi:hypothetical protein
VDIRAGRTLIGVVLGLAVLGLTGCNPFARKAGGDKPIIMTGGSLHFWSETEALFAHRGTTINPKIHRYAYTKAGTHLQRVTLKWDNGGRYIASNVDRVEVWYGVVADPTVTISDTSFVIVTDSESEPLKRGDRPKVKDPEDDSGTDLDGYDHEWDVAGFVRQVRIVFRGGRSVTFNWSGSAPAIRFQY